MTHSIENILLPVEIQHREFDGKLLLACEIAQLGKGAVIGSRVEIHKQIARLPYSIYHAKDALKSSLRILGIIQHLGCNITLLDEEAAVYHTAENYRERRLHAESLDKIGHIFAWGEDSKELVSQYNGYNDQPIHITGNPRIDMLRPELRQFYEAEARKHVAEHGKFLLVNTNFGKVNHFVQSLSLDVASKANAGSTYMKNSHKHRFQIYKAFRDMLPRLAANLGDVPIILRPHPAENQESWHELLDSFNNVKIIFDGNIIPWLMAAKATLHNGCTTAVESFLLGKMAFCYQPFAPSEYDLHLPNDLSAEYRDIELMTHAIKKQVETGRPHKIKKSQEKLAARFFANFDGPLASEALAEQLVSIAEKERVECSHLLSKLGAIAHAEGRAMVKRFNALNPEHKNSSKYTDHRFPGVSTQEVQAQINAYGRLLNRYRDVQVRQLDKHIFLIHKPG